MARKKKEPKELAPSKKGDLAQKEFAEIMEMKGWTCEIVRRARFAAGDMFGVADIVMFNLRQGRWGVVQSKGKSLRGSLGEMRAREFPIGTLKLVASRITTGDDGTHHWRVLDANAPPGKNNSAPYDIWPGLIEYDRPKVRK